MSVEALNIIKLYFEITQNQNTLPPLKEKLPTCPMTHISKQFNVIASFGNFRTLVLWLIEFISFCMYFSFQV